MCALHILLVILLHTGSSLANKIGCKDENNEDLDWFINYKLPKIKEEPEDSDLSNGVAYAYILAPGSKNWTLSTKNVLSGSMIEKTLDTYYNNEEDLTYLFYNDDPPGDQAKSAAGHLKGVFAFDHETGFWLIHSIPRFPDDIEYEYPESAEINGQDAICITFKTSELKEIAKQLLFDNPNIYAKALTKEVEDLLDEDARSLFSEKPKFVRTEPFTRKAKLTSLGGMKFTSFAKDNQLLEDLYSDIVAPALGTSLIAETWRRGQGGVLTATCSTDHTVVDVLSINMTLGGGRKKKTVFFEYTQDHSKWAISDEEDKDYVCLADLNRMISQEKRGGGAICFESRAVISAFDSIIYDNDKCSNTKSKRKGRNEKK